MGKHFSITRNQLKYLVEEVCRKLSLLNESVKEGGKAGHMYHPFEVDDFTFGDYKQLVRDLFEVNIEKFTEKLDGMNIFATVALDGSVRFARNSSDVKNEFGGMDPDGMAERWGEAGGDKTILAAYNNAYRIFTDVIQKLKDPVEFFNGDGYRIYANCEVIDQQHPNIISYPKTALSFHGLVALSNDGTGKEVDLPDEIFDKKMAALEHLLPNVKSQYGQAQVTPEVVIKIRENCENAIEKYTSLIDGIEQKYGVGDDTTIIEFRAKVLPEWLAENGYEILLNNPFTDYFIRRWVYEEKDPSITQYKKIMRNSGVQNWEDIFVTARAFEGDFKKKSPVKKVLAKIMWPLEIFFYRIGNEVIKGVEGYTNVGREKLVMDKYVEQLKQTQEMVAADGSLEFQEAMADQLFKLSMLGNEYNALEGIVFKYRGKTLKLTGSFAALNRAINIKISINNKKKAGA